MDRDQRLKIEPRFNRATDLWHEGKTGEAITVFEGLNKEFPNQPTILAMLGTIHYESRYYSVALTYFEKVGKFSPKSELASISLFYTLVRHERLDEAFAESQRFIKLNGLTEEYTLLMDELDEGGTFGRVPNKSL